MIFVRNDDVMIDSSGKYKGKEIERFKFVHQQVCRAPGKLIHCPAILCHEIQAFPEAIEYVKAEAQAGRMRPYLHCWDHSNNPDWTKKPVQEIEDMLKRCDGWFRENLDCEYYVWATPWGATSPAALEAAERVGIRLETTDETIEFKPAAKFVRQANSTDILDGKTILYHWWHEGLSLFRIVEAAVHGSWENAALAKPEWFK